MVRVIMAIPVSHYVLPATSVNHVLQCVVGVIVALHMIASTEKRYAIRIQFKCDTEVLAYFQATPLDPLD